MIMNDTGCTSDTLCVSIDTEIVSVSASKETLMCVEHNLAHMNGVSDDIGTHGITSGDLSAWGCILALLKSPSCILVLVVNKYVHNIVRLLFLFQHFPADSGVFCAAGHHLVRLHADRLPPLGIEDAGRGSRSEGPQHLGQQEKGNHPSIRIRVDEEFICL